MGKKLSLRTIEPDTSDQEIITGPEPKKLSLRPLDEPLKKKDESISQDSGVSSGPSGQQKKSSSESTPEEPQFSESLVFPIQEAQRKLKEADVKYQEALKLGDPGIGPTRIGAIQMEADKMKKSAQAALDELVKKQKSLPSSMTKDLPAEEKSRRQFQEKVKTESQAQQLIYKDKQFFTDAFYNTVKSVITDQLPKEYYVQRLKMSKGEFGDLFDPRSNLNAFSDKLPQGISREEFNLWNNSQPDNIRTQSYDNKAKIFLTQKLGPDGYERLRKQFEVENQEERVGFERQIQDQNREAFKKTEGIVQSIGDIKGASDFLNFAANMIGQTIARAPTSILTGAAGSILAESSAVYDRQIDLIAQREGISREEVINRGLDKPAEGQALAIMAGALDAASSFNMIGIFKRAIKKELTQSMIMKAATEFAKGAVPEALTEGLQGELEEIGAAKGAEVPYSPDAERVLTNVAGGTLGGGGVTTVTNAIERNISAPTGVLGSPAEIVQQQRETINPTDQASVDAASEKIEEALNQDVGKYTFDKPVKDAIQERTTAEVLQREPSEAGGPGGERAGVEPVIQGEEVAQESPDQNKAIAEKVETDTGPEAGKIEFKEKPPNTKDIDAFAERVLSGEVIKGADDLAFYNTNKDQINEALNRISFKRSAKERSQTEKTLDHPVLKKDYSGELNEEEKKFIEKRGGGIYDEVIPVRVIFKNDVLSTWEQFDKEKPALKQRFNKGEGKPETVAVEDIIPTDPLQKKFQIREKPDLKNRPLIYRNAQGQLLVTDGHHRIAEQILHGAKEIKALVINESNESNTNPTPEQPSGPTDAPVESPQDPTVPPGTTDQPPPGDKDTGGGETRKYAIAQRILASDASDVIKRGVKEKGADYVPKKLDITDTEAKNLIDLYGEDKTEALIRDTKNDITGDTRTALAARLYERYKDKADAATDPQTKQTLYDKAVDVALTSAEQLKEAGRQANAAKIWKAITQTEDMTILALERERARQNQALIQPIQKQVQESRQDFDEQVRKIIAQKVTEGVESNLKRAKLITTEKRQQISNAFDKLKVKDVGGAANDITRVLGAAVWNGSIEAVKRAVLAGADLANAVQAGVDYIRDNFKGEWDEQEFRGTIEPAVESMIPKEKIDADEIDQDAIKTPRLSGKKKKDFINQVVEAHNEGKLTDEQFERLYAKQLGAKEFSSEERKIIRGLAKTIAEAEKFEAQVKDNFTSENIGKYKELLAKAQKANDELQAYANKPNSLSDTLISIMQGNLLTPLSLITNIYSNIALQPLRFLSTGAGSLVDYSVSQMAKMGLLNQSYKDRTIDLAELQKGYFQGNWNGLLEGLDQLKTGPRSSERSVRELSSTFSPVRAIARWAEQDRGMAQKVNDYVEGTLGIPAEVMFRLLNLGDKPFRRGAELARALEIGKQKNLKGKEMEKFIMFPDEESADKIKKAGDEATFQQDSASSKVVQEVLNKIVNGIGNIPGIGGALKVLVKSQIPYVKTPWNIMTETLQYAAFPITGMIGIRQIAQGDKRNGSILIGKALVGAMIFTVAKELFIKGLMSWDEPYDQKKGKQRERRQIQYDNIPPNALNVSAIQRGLIGDEWEIKDDDTWVDYSKFGPMGLLFESYANNYFDNIREKGQAPEDSNFYVDMLTTAPRILSQSLDQSFLKGTNTLLTAIQDGGGYETEQWLINTAGALSSIVYPNTLGTISKSSDEFIRDTRDDSFVEKLKNTYKVKFFLGEQLPPKINLWGDKVTGNPEGRNKYAYYLFDPSKFKEVDAENFRYRLYEAWKQDQFNDDWLPSIPKRDITYRGVKIQLNSEQYAKFSEYVGKERARLVSTYVNSSGFERKDKEKVLKRLEDLYQEGRKRGQKKFLMDQGWNILTPTKLSQIEKKP